MQRRLYNYREDDKTFLLNQHLIGIVDAGRYRGFEYESSVGMSLTLGHTNSGIIQVGQDILPTAPMGLWRTRQGTIITEDAAITLNLNSNPSGNPRIDLIVGSHHHVESVGGIVATYSVVQGTPAATPVAPALVNANRDVILARVLVPAGAVTILPENVMAEPIPKYANDQSLATLNTIQDFTASKGIKGEAHEVGHGKFDLANSKLVLGYTGTFGTQTYKANQYANYFHVFGEVLGTPLPTTPVDVTEISFLETRRFFGSNAPKTQRITLYFTSYVRLINSTKLQTPDGNDVVCEPYVPIVLYQPYGNASFTLPDTQTEDYWVIENAGELRKSGINKVTGLISLSAETLTPNASLQLIRSSTQPRNHIKIGGTNALDSFSNSISRIEYISTSNYTQTSLTEQGTEITIWAQNPDISGQQDGMEIITALQGSAAPAVGFKPIYNPNGYHIKVIKGGSVTLVETPNYWVVKATSGEVPYWASITSGTFNANLAYPENAQVALYKGYLMFRGILRRATGSGNINAPVLTLVGTLPSAISIYGHFLFNMSAINHPVLYSSTAPPTYTFITGYLTQPSLGNRELYFRTGTTLSNANDHTIFLDGVILPKIQ